MSSKILFFTLFLLSSFSVFTQVNPAVQQIKVDVVYLASDYLQGRGAGTAGEQLAAEYIANRFETMGLYPIGDNGTFFQSFPLSKTVENTPTGKNVLAYLDKGAETTVIISGHYDHLGANPTIQNGANSNASGIAALLYLAESLMDGAAQNNYLFIAFSGKEKGLLGSKYYVENPVLSLDRINYMLNMDGVGQLNTDKTIIMNGVGTSRIWKKAIWAIRSDAVKTNLTDSGVGTSDHTSFYLIDVPVVHFSTGTAPETTTDKARDINMEGIQILADYTLRFIKEIDSKGRLDFIETEEKHDSRRASKYKVTLGVMPDYVFGDGGMRIEGVIADRPAAKAGFEKGDIITKVGKYNIKNIYAYMDILNKFDKGDKVKVLVNRGGKIIKKKVRF